MPWGLVELNDGNYIPSIAFGTWEMGNGQGPIDQIDQALSVGFVHIDTAQYYRNEAEAGIAIHKSGLPRENIYITTKYSALNNLDIQTSITNSLEQLGVTYVDLYLIHHPSLVPDIPAAWREMEALKEKGLVKSIGVSNFGVSELEILLASAKIKPAANQIQLHPYVYAERKPILEYAAKQGIAIEAYSALVPIIGTPGGPIDKPLSRIADDSKVTPDQVLLAWVKAKGAIVVTTSSKKSRLEGYLNAGDLELSLEDIAAIDEAGARNTKQSTAKVYLHRIVALALAGALVFGVCSYFGINIL